MTAYLLLGLLASHERVTWKEPNLSGDLVPASLEIWTSNPEMTRCTLRARLETRSGVGQPSVWDCAYDFSDPKWAQIDYAIPIHVQGSRRPQLLVRRSRSNWGDYLLYTASEDGLHEGFSASHRDPACTKWIAKDGVLNRIVFFDRWLPAHRPEPKGKRWQRRIEYAYDPKSERWRAVSSRWETYRFGASLPNAVIERPADCLFRFNRQDRHPNAREPLSPRSS